MRLRNWCDLREQLLRLAALLRRGKAEREMADELEFHLAMKQEKYERQQGLGQSDAAARAKREFGSIGKWKEFCRDAGRARFVEDFGRDVALALRMLRKSPGFTVVALITLALAIGANTAIFSLMNALLLRPLDVPQADRLALLRIQPDEFGYAFNYPLFQYVEKHAEPFLEVFAFTGRNLQIHTRDGVERVAGQLVSGQYFAALKVNPEMGRYIGPRNDHPGGTAAVISDGFWRRWFGADPHVLGRKLVLNNAVFTVIGVMPREFRGASKDERPDVFLPFEAEPAIDAPYNNIAAGAHAWWFNVGARLRNGLSLEQSNAFLRTISHAAFDSTMPDAKSRFNGHTRSELYLVAEPGATGYSGLRLRFHKPLTVLMALVSLVLLIACLNLATLLMARAASREREIATRFALGATRPRLLRQLLTESVLLAAAGTGLGLAVSPVVANLLVTFLTTGQDLLHPPLNVAPDARVFLFTAVVAVIATVLTGLAPALRSTGRELQQRMRDSSSALRGAERRRFWPRVLLACEVALALVLVTGASLLGLSIVKLHQVPLGFDPNNLIFLQLEMNKQPRRGKALVRTYHDIAGALAKIPGVAAVSFLDVTPMEGSRWRDDAAVPGKPAHEMFRNQVGPDYFRAMRTPLVAGREFSWNDADESGRVVILNEAAARVLFAGASPLGQRVQVGEKQLGEVVGVVANTKYSSLRVPDPPEVYSSITQDVKDPSYTAVLRATGPPSAVIAAAREIVRRVMPDIPPPVAVTMEQTLAQSLATERMMATLALFFGAIALLITGIGLYGTLAYATERRTGEIGIRIALGAQRGDVISMMCAENGAVALGGCIAGILGAMAAARLIASFLYGTSPRNPAVLALSAAALMCIAAAASLIPAIRAARLDPMAAIRHE